MKKELQRKRKFLRELPKHLVVLEKNTKSLQEQFSNGPEIYYHGSHHTTTTSTTNAIYALTNNDMTHSNMSYN